MIISLARYSKRFALSLAGLALVGCAVSTAATEHEGAGSVEMAFHAFDTDLGTRLYRVQPPAGEPLLLLVSNHHGYALTCDTADGVLALANGAGFTAAEVQRLPLLPLDGEEIRSALEREVVRMIDVVRLPCNLPEGSLVPLSANPARPLAKIHYFVNLGDTNDSGHEILHDIGCEPLLNAMGFARTDWFRPTPAGSDTSDRYDINCRGPAPEPICTPIAHCPPFACQDIPDGCGGTLHCTGSARACCAQNGGSWRNNKCYLE
jgi:hypothetical protein